MQGAGVKPVRWPPLVQGTDVAGQDLSVSVAYYITSLLMHKISMGTYNIGAEYICVHINSQLDFA
jgi:hypothetical protein